MSPCNFKLSYLKNRYKIFDESSKGKKESTAQGQKSKYFMITKHSAFLIILCETVPVLITEMSLCKTYINIVLRFSSCFPERFIINTFSGKRIHIYFLFAKATYGAVPNSELDLPKQ